MQELVLKHATPVSQASLSPDVSASYQLPQEEDTPQDKESSESSEHEAMQVRFVKEKTGKNVSNKVQPLYLYQCVR